MICNIETELTALPIVGVIQIMNESCRLELRCSSLQTKVERRQSQYIHVCVVWQILFVSACVGVHILAPSWAQDVIQEEPQSNFLQKECMWAGTLE
mmetsp:Transcript_37883/g.67400  ORF Transcript_37883/g.67400 Transcript_37883/m.67400 type:complete len:96 (+) Transcript_37883:557-844(+)